ncbi:9643_t:CDS:10 [Paraglomus occultum]|uniref:9643_t:CDS:1 n=1 Tax=Paraglomus occultum TaxID=144539 RepID=A0A9N8VYB1_9GLOM|nr:9643_t:CDS:10 [Paraglomus occultum]
MRLPSSQRNIVELEKITTSSSDDDPPTPTPMSSTDHILLKPAATTFDSLQSLEDGTSITAPAQWHKAVPSGIIERINRGTKASRRDYTELSQSGDELGEDEEDSAAKLKKQKIILHDGLSESRPERSLALEAMPPLLISVAGLMFTGWLLDVVQDWKVFKRINELFILVPVLLNLKGNLEMNLASRMSTSSNLGELDQASARDALIWGNLALLQVQALIVGAVAGFFSFSEELAFHPHANTYFESMLVIVASMICATLSSMILGTFMCALIIVSRKFRINPDNIACPMASALGDLLTLIILAVCSDFLQKYMFTWMSTWMFVILTFSIPLWARLVWTNKYVQDLLINGWVPLFVAMIIASIAGLVLERYIKMYQGLAVLTPVLNGLAGNLGSIYASRISTRLHSGTEEDYKSSEKTLFLIHIPIEILFLLVAWWLDLGHLPLGFCVLFTLVLTKNLTLWLWRHKYDPDNYSMPYITAIVDVVGTGLLVLSYSALGMLGEKIEKHH